MALKRGTKVHLKEARESAFGGRYPRGTKGKIISVFLDGQNEPAYLLEVRSGENPPTYDWIEVSRSDILTGP